MDQVKKENVVADLKVFLGEGEVADNNFKNNKFQFSTGVVDVSFKENIRKRSSTVSSLFNKLSQKPDLIKQENESLVSKIIKKGKEEEKISSKIKLSKPPTDAFGKVLEPAQLKPALEISKFNLLPQVSKAIEDINDIDDDDDDNKNVPQDESSNLLEVLNKIKIRHKVPPPLIPLGQENEEKKLLNIPDTDVGHFSRETLLPGSNISVFKNAETLNIMLQPDLVKLLFKCMHPTCHYATNSVTEFRNHILEHNDERCLRCCYCFGRVTSVDKLISHVIRRHGHQKYQCLQCFHRKRRLS